MGMIAFVLRLIMLRRGLVGETEWTRQIARRILVH